MKKPPEDKVVDPTPQFLLFYFVLFATMDTFDVQVEHY